MREPPAVAAIVHLLDANGIAHVLHRHVAVATIEEAQRLVPHLTVDLLKTVAFEISGTSRVLLVAVRAEDQVDYRGVAAVAGCNRRALRLMPGARVAAEFGFEVGGVGPFRVDPRIEVVLDAAAADLDQVKVGGGSRSLTCELAFTDLARLGDAVVAAVSKNAPT
ncbi:MAG: YbaK/EbsC family protein [Gammaproteobacteria bacterium]|nr:YbaK/EbsC family protein [Gammaproteobacteria bacterium]